MISFADLTDQVHLIKDLIMSDMVYENVDRADEQLEFNKHLGTTKYWFARVSAANKKRFLIALLEDIRSVWALSLLLKSIWNCRPKDAVLSLSACNAWSSYDEVPMDHNRTALPVVTLVQVMKNDRKWFVTLAPEPQALVLSELLTIAGGPIMWEVLKRAQAIYERCRDQQFANLQECTVVNDPSPDRGHPPPPEKNKKESSPPPRRKSSNTSGSPGVDTTKQSSQTGQAQKELDTQLAAWNITIKSMRDSLKLEELEMIFNDGTKKKIWKVNRPKPETIETVDFLQLLPSAIGKRILSYLPRLQLGDYARVNKYWAYLIDEFRAEIVARQKIDSELEKLQESMLRHDTSMDILAHTDLQLTVPSSHGYSTAPSTKTKQLQPSVRTSEKSVGAYSFRHLLIEKQSNVFKNVQKPIRNMADFLERLERRGAVDENVWNWCANVLKRNRQMKRKEKKDFDGGVLSLGNVHFPCPLMKQALQIPLHPPLYKDPTATSAIKSGKNISNATAMNTSKEQNAKRYSLWSKDFSCLYPVFKIPSYQSPV